MCNFENTIPLHTPHIIEYTVSRVVPFLFYDLPVYSVSNNVPCPLRRESEMGLIAGNTSSSRHVSVQQVCTL